MESAQRDGQGFKKRDEDFLLQDEHSPFWAIEKGAVLQEARCFNDTQLSTRKCQQVITKLLYLYNQGERFTATEATEVFFSVTKLFHATDGSLRRLLYLIIKEISPSSDEVIIVTSSLMKDMNSKIDLYRANSIRVLCSITDSGLLGQIERFLKQAVVDKSPIVSSSALVSGLRLMKMNPEIVRRWSSEVQEAANSDDPVVQFHAITLLHQIKQNDKLAVSKLVLQCIRSNIRSPLATCSVIRYISEILQDGNGADTDIYHGFLESCLRNKSEMVVFEAAKSIATLPDVDSRLLHSSMMVLQLLLSSPKPILRFGAVRALNSIAIHDPATVAVCNVELESLVADTNRAISTLAVTTLLRTGGESSVDRLMQQISSLFAGLQDEYKLTIIDAIKSLCTKYPSKHRTLIIFLSSSLREEGGFEYKRSIVGCLLHIVHANAKVKELGLMHLSEFIEDCEYTQLSIHILHVLGEDGPSTEDPSKFIRYIYNRLFLENAAIRAAAVSALTNFGMRCSSLRDQLAVLLLRCVHDIDDEVRDRATLFRHWLKIEGTSSIPDLSSIQVVESALGIYLESEMKSSFQLQDVRVLSQATTSQVEQLREPEVNQTEDELQFISVLRAEKEFADFDFSDGEVLSSTIMPLTECETEYKVTCVKHVTKDHVIFQFAVVNTIEEQILENVTVNMDVISNLASEFDGQFTVVLPLLRVDARAFTYVCFTRTIDTTFSSRFTCSLHFTSKEIDPLSGEPDDVGYEDDYLLEDVEVTFFDFVSPLKLNNVLDDWDSLPTSTEIAERIDMGQHSSVDNILRSFVSVTRLSVCHMFDGSGGSGRSYMLAASVNWDEKILVKVEFIVDAAHNVIADVTARSGKEAVTAAFQAALATNVNFFRE